MLVEVVRRVLQFEKVASITTSTARIYVATHSHIFTPLRLYSVQFGIVHHRRYLYWLCAMLMTRGLVFNQSTMVGVI